MQKYNSRYIIMVIEHKMGLENDMEYLDEFKKRISLVDGMFIETGGQFGKRYLQNYIKDCLAIAHKYYEVTKDTNSLMLIVDFYITHYEKETSWKYYQYEMEFLMALKADIEKLCKI